jgi:hypothetical protein
MIKHLSSIWEIPGEPYLGEKPAPATRWHLHVNRQVDWQVYLNTYEDGGRRRSTITHEVAASARHTRHTFYQLFVKKSQGSVRHFAADGANLVTSGDPSCQELSNGGRPDMLLTPEDVRWLRDCLQARWRGSDEQAMGRGRRPRVRSRQPGAEETRAPIPLAVQ